MKDQVDNTQDALSAQIRRPSGSPFTSATRTTTISSSAAHSHSPCPQVGPSNSGTMHVYASGRQETMFTPLHRNTPTYVSAPKPARARQESVPDEFLGIARLEPPPTAFVFDVRHVPDPQITPTAFSMSGRYQHFSSSVATVSLSSIGDASTRKPRVQRRRRRSLGMLSRRNGVNEK